MAETHIFPIVVAKGPMDEHDIQHPLTETFPIPAGAPVNINGIWGYATQKIEPGDHGTIKFGNLGTKLEVTHDQDSDIAAGDRIELDR